MCVSLGSSTISEDGDAASLRVECSSSDGDEEEGGIDLYRLRFHANRSENSFEYSASSSTTHATHQAPSTSSGSVNVNASIKVSSRFFYIR